MEGLLPSEAIELLREPLESLGFVQLWMLGFWVFGVATRRGIDRVVEFLFVRLLKSVLAEEQGGEVKKEPHLTKSKRQVYPDKRFVGGERVAQGLRRIGYITSYASVLEGVRSSSGLCTGVIFYVGGVRETG